MTKPQLIGASIVADLLDLFVVGQVPGVSWFIDIPVILMHVAFAGGAGWATVVELIPFVGTFPVFTIAGMIHGPKDETQGADHG